MTLSVLGGRVHDMGARILLVEDDAATRDMIAVTLQKQGMTVDLAASAEEGLERLGTESYDAILTDLEMGGMSGIDLAKRVADGPNLPVIVLTGRADLERAIAAIRAGVADFLQKPVSFDVLAIAVERALRHRALSEEVVRLRAEAEGRTVGFDDMIGESRSLRDLQELVSRVAPSDVPVLVTGESGTGKELVATALHQRSHRKEAPFIAVNCAAVPPSLLESELFGHVKGSFTDAREDKDGLFVAAEGGTIFLDEIGEMPMEMQAKLLRALQQKRVRPVGAKAEVAFDARVVAATNRDLEEEVEEGRFREDLYYRVNVVHLAVPPLRARGRDILLLAQAFVERAASRSGRPVKGIAQSAAQLLLGYEWPGNVRELENSIERGVALTRFAEITAEDLPEKVRRFGPKRTDEVALEAELPSLEELERRHIVRVLKHCGGNKTKAASILGLDRRTLYRKAERYGFDL